jgi:hypothetical protein
MYQIVKLNNEENLIHSTLGFIPADEANVDYQAYLAWVAEGNTAEEWSPE